VNMAHNHLDSRCSFYLKTLFTEMSELSAGSQVNHPY
jgi:hypothetical protein